MLKMHLRFYKTNNGNICRKTRYLAITLVATVGFPTNVLAQAASDDSNNAISNLVARPAPSLEPAPQPAADRAEKPPLSTQTALNQPFFLHSSTQFSYTYYAATRYPGVPGVKPGSFLEGRSAPANALTISHVDTWSFGTNFINLDIIRSGSQTPAGSPLPHIQDFDYGQTTVVANYRGTLSGNAIAGSPIFVLPGFIKDISIVYGGDHIGDNTLYSLLRNRVVGGIAFAFDVPESFINISILAQKDWTRFADLTAPRRNTDSNVVPRIELSYTIPLAFTQLPLSLAGFMAYNPPRGLDPHGGTFQTEIVSRTDLVLDVGSLIYSQPNRIKAFAGFFYLRNMGGSNSQIVPGTITKTFLAGLTLSVF